jgi:hypothetical protein
MPPNVYPDTHLEAVIDELASLLARGVVRHFEQRARDQISADDSRPLENSESRRDCLEVSNRTVLSVLTGLRTRDSERKRA